MLGFWELEEKTGIPSRIKKNNEFIYSKCIKKFKIISEYLLFVYVQVVLF